MNALLSPSIVTTMEQGPEGAPKVRKARLEDYSGIAALHDRHGFTSRSYDEWTSLWTRNPLYNKLTNWPIGWVLETENGSIVGHLGNIPLPYVFRGERLLAATSRAWIVDSGFRSYSFSLASRFFQQRRVDLFLNTTVNNNAVRGYEAFRMNRVPVGAWDESIFWITNYRGFATSFLTEKGIPAPKLLSLPASFGLLAGDKFANKSLRASRPTVSIKFVNHLDDRFDSFWDQLQRRRSDVLLADRSKEVLEWHFQRSLADDRTWILTIEDGPHLTGYAVFMRRDNPTLGLKRLRLIDFQSLERRNDLLVPILGLALTRCRMQGIHMLEIMGLNPANQRILEHGILHKRALPSWLYFYKTNDSQLATALKDPSSWDPSCFDGDASL
jgi:hypothetical protein